MIIREIYPKLKKHLESEKITLITGPRQSGKTTLMRMLMEELDATGFKHTYLNLDIEKDFQVLSSQTSLLNFLDLELGTTQKSYVFIDEIQRKEDAGIFLKGIYDMGLSYKFVVSGSGSVELKEKVSEGLAGRKETFKVGTISLKEYINYKTNYKYQGSLGEYMDSEIADKYLLDRYMEFGGYPELVTKETKDEKRAIIESIYESFVDKDIKDLLGVKNVAAFSDVLTFLSTRIGKLTDRTSISNKVNIAYETAREYVYYLNKTFIIDNVKPYSTNPETEISKTPMYYFTDLGMRNFVFNRMTDYNPIVSGSVLFQNLVMLLLKQEDLAEVKYWRTKDMAEVDFVVSLGSKLIPVEVKYADLETTGVGKSVISYIDKYKPEKFLVVNLSMRGDRKIGGTNVEFIPYYDLLTKSILG